MIKTEKTVTDLAGRLKIVDSCDMCRLGLTDGKRVSVIPVSFGYTFLNGNFTFYMKGDCFPDGLGSLYASCGKRGIYHVL